MRFLRPRRPAALARRLRLELPRDPRDVDESSGAASAAPLAPPLEGLEVPRRDHEVARLRVMEDERRHRRLGVHHVALGETHADGALNVEGAEELLLVLQARAGGVAEAHPHAAVARLEALP